MESLNGPKNGQIPPIVAAVMALNNYPIGIDKARLQRVADEMLQFGLLHTRFDIGQLLGPSNHFAPAIMVGWLKRLATGRRSARAPLPSSPQRLRSAAPRSP